MIERVRTIYINIGIDKVYLMNGTGHGTSVTFPSNIIGMFFFAFSYHTGRRRRRSIV